MSPAQARLHDILDPILRREPEGRRIYGEAGLLGAGETVRMPDLAVDARARGRGGGGTLYGGELGRIVSGYCLERGGKLTLEDLASYRVVRSVARSGERFAATSSSRTRRPRPAAC